jgi:hypothetical protein
VLSDELRTNAGYSTTTGNDLASDGCYAYLCDGERNRTARFVDTNNNGQFEAKKG